MKVFYARREWCRLYEEDELGTLVDGKVIRDIRYRTHSDTILCVDNAHRLDRTIYIYIYIPERRGSVVVSTSAWHAAGRWFDSRTRHVSLLG